MATATEGGPKGELVFHQRCGRLAVVMNGGTVARRSNYQKEFNHGVVLTNRPLKDGELFEICITKVTEKWAGSVEIGVTTHSPEMLQFPSTMTNMTTGTWMVSGSGVMCNSNSIKDNLKVNLDLLKVGQTLGIMRKEGGSLVLYTDGQEQGVVVTTLPKEVYGVVDLYGQCFEVTICGKGKSSRPVTGQQSSSNIELDRNTNGMASLHFGFVTGENVEVSPDGMLATRLDSEEEFTKATVFTNRVLNPSEWFEVRIEDMVDCWSGSLQIGVCSSSPQSLDFSDFDEASDLTSGTWVLTGTEIFHLGQTMEDDYPLDLDTVPQGSKVAVMVTASGELHFAVNGIDMGCAARNIPQGVFGVVDVYGQCTKVHVTVFEPNPDTVTADFSVQTSILSRKNLSNREKPTSVPMSYPERPQGPTEHRFHANYGSQIALKDVTTARRLSSYKGGVTFSAFPLDNGNLFEVKILSCENKWSGQLKMGVTTTDPFSLGYIPPLSTGLPPDTWIISGSSVLHNGIVVRENYGHSLSRLQVGHKVGLLKQSNGNIHIYLNGEDLGIAAGSIFQKVYAVVDIYGRTESVQIISTPSSILSLTSSLSSSSLLSNSARSRTNSARKLLPSNTLPLQRKADGKCSYRQLCHRYLSSLALPEPYFDPTPSFSKCYCAQCHQQKEAVRYQGVPQQKYTLPLGWVKFALRVPPQAKVHDIFGRWHVAYHGTFPGNVRTILDCGELLLPGDLTLSSVKLERPEGHFNEGSRSAGLDVNQIFMTPSIHYCSAGNVYSTKYRDTVTGGTYIVRVAFKLRVEPSSYCIYPQTLLQDNAKVIDHLFSNSELEWCTKHPQVTYLYGLIVKLEENSYI